MPPSLRATPLLALASLLLAGCGRHETAVQTSLRTKILHVGNFAEPRDLDPHLVTLATDFNIVFALFEGLVALDEATATPVPAIAERWEFSADRLTCTFHLRADARWSNGDPVTAQDFAYSFQRILSPGLGAEYAYMLWPIKNAEAFTTGKLKDFAAVGIATPDARTLRLTLERPTPHLLGLAGHVSWFPVHRPTIEKFGRIDQRGTAWTRPGNLVSNGAFVLSEWRPNAHIAVVRNPRYRLAPSNRLNGVTFRPIENADAEERDYRAGQLHVTYTVPLQKFAAYREQSGSPLRVEAGLRSNYLVLNTSRPPFDNPALRRALALGTERNTTIRQVGYGAWTPARSLTPPHCGDYTAPECAPEDFAAAREALARAGFPGGKGAPRFAIHIAHDPDATRLAEVLQATWRRELGLDVTIEATEQKIWWDALNSHRFDVGIAGWIADYPDATTFLDLFRTGNGNNLSAWSNPAYDALLDRASLALGSARNELLRQAEELLLREAPLVPLYFTPKIRLVHPTVRHWTGSPLDFHRYHLLDLQP